MKNYRYVFTRAVALLSLWLSSSLLAAAPTLAATRHSLWKIQGPDATVYLLGSVHFLQESNYPLAKPIEDAFKTAETVAFETDIGQMESLEVQAKLLAKAMLPDGQTLAQQLSPETYKQFTNHLAGTGLPLLVFQQLRPGMAAITLTMMELQRMGLDPQLGIDFHFYKRAKKEDKEIVPLETIEFQIDMITGIMGEDGEMLMKSTLKDIAKTRTQFADMVRAWETGNTKDLEALLNEALEESPALYKRLLTDRNRTWVPAIEKLLRGKKNALVIVGAGHLVGKDSVVDLLAQKGHKPVQQ